MTDGCAYTGDSRGRKGGAGSRRAIRAAGAAAALAALVAPLQASAQDATIEEIVVTAQKRTERLVDVPVSISVFSDDAIDQTGVRELKDIADYIPNLGISEGNDFRSTVTIRGVGAQSRNIGFDSRVGVYVDGVYVGQSPAINQELLNLERIEVLRGPQGTLFGKNTVAGAINLVTKKPGDEFSARIGADLGNLDYRELKALVNVPFSEAVSGSFAVSKTDRDGYVRNIVTGNDLNARDVLAYRAQLRIGASEKLEINASFDGLNSDSLILVGDPITDMLALQPVQVAPEFGVVAFSFDPFDKRDIYGGALDFTYDLDSGHVLKSITGYRTTDAVYSNATDYSPVDIVSIEYADDYDVLSQEFQFISPDEGAFTYVAGLYYYRQDAKTNRDVVLGQQFIDAFVGPLYASGQVSPPNGPLPPPPALPNDLVAQLLEFGPPGSKVFNRGEVNTRSYAAYFNGTYDLTERMKLGFGARYSTEDKDVNWLLDGRNSGIFFIGSTGPDPLNPSPLINDRTDNFFAPAVSLTYALTDDTNVYARYAAGYKSGGFNLDYINAVELAANQGLEFDKETVDSYEIGMKGAFLDSRLHLNLAAFIANYDDYQVNQFVDLGGGRTSIRINNAAKVETSGVEAEANWRVTEDFTLRASLGLLDATFESFPGGGTAGADASGNDLPNAPDTTASFGGIFYHGLPSLGSTLLMRADVNYASEYFSGANNDTAIPYNSAFPGMIPYGQLPERTEVNARIGLMSDNETWEVYLWGRNLTDETGPQDELRDFFGTVAKLPSLPRTYGVEFGWNFE
ncbi:MAG TPA: TonB-dependent receptor [Woeseiaceae bacterium]|nr:TonB-dependent receptor [Woeseiaceae bacterium]